MPADPNTDSSFPSFEPDLPASSGNGQVSLKEQIACWLAGADFLGEQTRTALSGLCGLAAIAATRGESEIGAARGRIAAGYRPR